MDAQAKCLLRKNIVNLINLIYRQLIIFTFCNLLSASGQKYRNGTCLTAAECLEQSGSSSGSCAGGYSCVFET